MKRPRDSAGWIGAPLAVPRVPAAGELGDGARTRDDRRETCRDVRRLDIGEAASPRLNVLRLNVSVRVSRLASHVPTAIPTLATFSLPQRRGFCYTSNHPDGRPTALPLEW